MTTFACFIWERCLNRPRKRSTRILLVFEIQGTVGMPHVLIHQLWAFGPGVGRLSLPGWQSHYFTVYLGSESTKKMEKLLLAKVEPIFDISTVLISIYMTYFRSILRTNE